MQRQGLNAENPHLKGVLAKAANIAASVILYAWVWHLLPNPANLVTSRFLNQAISLGLQGTGVHGIDPIEVFDLIFSDVDWGFHDVAQDILGAWGR
jgi:hypothetical protein